MKKTNFSVALLAAMGLSAIATPAMAYEEGDWLVRARVVNVNPHDDSGLLSVPALGGAIADSGVTVDSDTIPELDITYMFHRNWGVELILGYSEHDVDASGSVKGLLGNVVDAKALPPTLTLQYHFAPDSNIRPYLGAGINYTYFFDESVEGVLDVPGAKVDLESSWGLAVQAGLDIAINEDWFFNMDVKYIDIDTTARFKDTSVGRAKINVEIDPVVFGIGIGRRF